MPSLRFNEVEKTVKDYSVDAQEKTPIRLLFTPARGGHVVQHDCIRQHGAEQRHSPFRTR